MKSYMGLKSKHGLVVAPVRASAGIRVKYQKKLDDLAKQMHTSVIYHLKAAYRRRESDIVGLEGGASSPLHLPPHEGLLRAGKARPYANEETTNDCRAQAGVTAEHDLSGKGKMERGNRRLPLPVTGDSFPAADIMKTVKGLFKKWKLAFSKSDIARWFANAIFGNVTRQLTHNIESAAEITLKTPKMTRHVRGVLEAVIESNAALINSIPEKYFKDIERLVLESIQCGRDLEYLTDILEENYGGKIGKYFGNKPWRGFKGVREHCALIARDQVNKCTQVVSNITQKELGITHNIWKHSHGGKVPRKTHVDFNGQEFDIDVGLYDDEVKRNVYPGELINCRCSSMPVVPLFDHKRVNWEAAGAKWLD
jgi:hypothetical protein